MKSSAWTALSASAATFGFDTAVNIATEAIDRLHSTASSHKRVMVVEVMGHHAGWIALYAGMAGGADVILLPELGFDMDKINEVILDRARRGKPYSIVVVAEGIETPDKERPSVYVTRAIEETTGIESRDTVLGYIQRGGNPSPFDRNLATRLGGHATELIANRQFGRMVCMRGSEVESIPLSEVACFRFSFFRAVHFHFSCFLCVVFYGFFREFLELVLGCVLAGFLLLEFRDELLECFVGS